MSSKATGSREFLVNTEKDTDKFFSVVTGLADGGWVVSWTSTGQDGSGDGVYQQRFNADGTKAGQETLVNSTTVNGQYDPRITMLEDGGWIVAWTSGEDESIDTDYGIGVYQQRYDVTGARVGEESHVNITLVGTQSASSVHMLNDGGWIVTWNSDWYNPFDGDIYQRRYSATGEAGEAEILVNTTTTTFRSGPVTTLLADGGWLVSWTYEEAGNDSFGIYQQRFDADGEKVEGEVKVDPVMAGSAFDPQVAALADGGWIVAWHSYLDNEDGNVFQQRFDQDGAAIGDAVEVSKGRDDDQTGAAVAALADGGWVVCWRDQSIGGGLYQQRYDADGNRIGNQTQIGSGWLESVSVAGLEDGSWIVTWHSGYKSDTYNIYQRHFAPDINGGDEADDLVGTDWDERISGLDGADTLSGGGGRDVLTGGKGQDVLVGDAGADTFIFLTGDTRKSRAGADTIVDFSVKQKDVIDLSAIDANTRGSKNSFEFIGTLAFHKEAGELRYEKKGGDTYVMGDTDGNAKADFMIHLDGVVEFVEGRFDL